MQRLIIFTSSVKFVYLHCVFTVFVNLRE